MSYLTCGLQEKFKFASSKRDIDEALSSNVHPSFRMIMNTSDQIQHFNENDAFQLHGGALSLFVSSMDLINHFIEHFYIYESSKTHD